MEELFSMSLGIGYPYNNWKRRYTTDYYDDNIVSLAKIGCNLYSSLPININRFYTSVSEDTPLKIIAALILATPLNFFIQSQSWLNTIEHIKNHIKNDHEYYIIMLKMAGLNWADNQESYSGENFIKLLELYGTSNSIISLIQEKISK